MMFSTDLGNSFTFKCFLQFTCTNLDGSQKEGVTLNLLQNKGGTQKEGRGFPQKGGFQPWRKLWTIIP